MEARAHNGREIKEGQTWVSSDGEFESFIVGFSTEGFPVIEKCKGWPTHGYTDIEKYWKSMFLHELKSNE